MKNIKQDVVISDKFREQLDGFNIYAQVQKKGEAAFRGSINKLDQDLFILKDEKGKDICGILDCRSFMEALLDTEVAHLWAYDNRKKIGTAN